MSIINEAPPSRLSISGLQDRCKQLLSELDYFTSYTTSHHHSEAVELRSFRSGILAELKSLGKLSASVSSPRSKGTKAASLRHHVSESSPPNHGEEDSAAEESDDERISHTLRSSNVPFYETVWAVAKHSKGVIAFNRRFYWSAPTRQEKRAAKNPSASSPALREETHDAGADHNAAENGAREAIASSRPGRKHNKLSAPVDIVSDNGGEWIKVSTVTETRLLFELARQGWHNSDDSDSSADNGKPDSNVSDDEDEVSILKAAHDLSRASRAHRVRYRHPRIRIVLPKVTAGSVEAIDKLIRDMRATRAIVETADVLSLSPSDPVASGLPQVPVADAIAQGYLAYDAFANLSSTLNIDCTILLALVSDLSHAKVDAEPWFHSAVRRQIEVEEKGTLLPSVLYPVLQGRSLVCTEAAVTRMREIVQTIGTESEKARTEVLLGSTSDGDEEDHEQDEMRHQWAKWSDHEVPLDLELPIRTVYSSIDVENVNDAADATETQRQALASIASKVATSLSDLNKSVFLYSWRTGRTCITSNRAVVKQIEASIGEVIDECEARGEEIRGLDVWLCGMARSLVGKEKDRKESHTIEQE